MDGNKLRDALRKARVFIDCSPLKKVEGDFGCIDRDEICAEIDAILAEPVKNCEVGTPEEQSRRFDAFCDAHKYVGDDGANWCSRNCPCYNDTNCGVQWAQMPYESEAAK